MIDIIKTQENKIHSIQNATVHNAARLMNNEVVIGGLAEGVNENCKKTVVNFIQKTLGYTSEKHDVITAYHTGS